MSVPNKLQSDVNKDARSSAEEERFIEIESKISDDGLGSKWLLWKRRRYIVVMMTFLGQVTREGLRTNLSVALLRMTENRTATNENGTTINIQDFDWNTKFCGFLLSVFYYGYLSTNLLGGILAVKYGGSRLYGVGIAITAASTLLTPAAASIHFYLLVSLRIFEGMCEGILSPSMEMISATWIPLEERSFLVGILVTGMSWGVFLGIMVSSTIVHHWGWRAVFYITGGFGIVWYLTWLYIVKENPRRDKKISPSELAYIENSLGKKNACNGRTKVLRSIPCMKIMTSVPVWALVLSGVPIKFTYAIFTTMLPAFMKDVLKQDTQKSGYLTALPFAAKLVTVYCVSVLADCLSNRNILTATATRKLYICGGLAGMAVFCFLVPRATATPVIIGCLVGVQMCSGTAMIQFPLVYFIVFKMSY